MPLYPSYLPYQAEIVLQPWVPVQPPAGWTWSLPFSLQRKGRLFRPHPSWSLRSLASRGKAYYVSPTGSDANDGLSWASAFRSIWKAATQADAVEVYIQAGYYGYNNGFRGAPNNASTFIGVGGQVVANNDLELSTWTPSANSWRASTTQGVDCVLDWLNLDGEGFPTFYTERASAAEVDANPASWYKDGATNTLYVRCSDSRQPDANLRAYRNTAVLNLGTVNRTLYFENITFEVSAKASRHLRFYASTTAGGLRLYMQNCTLRHSQGTYDLLDIDGLSEVILQNCQAYNGPLDGFNYHAFNGVVPRAIEIRCSAHHCGTSATSINNASAMHDGGSIVRIMGDYHRSYGPVVVDANGSSSWNLGVVAHHCLSSGGATSKSTFYCANGGATLMWLDNCQSYSPGQYDLVVEAGATLYKRRFHSGGNFSAAGALEEY